MCGWWLIFDHWLSFEVLWAVNLSINWCTKTVIIEDRIEVAMTAHFLKEAEDNLIYAYYIYFNESQIISLLFLIYKEFADVFNEKAEEMLPPDWSELNHIIELLLNITLFFRLFYNLSKEELQILKNYIDQHLQSRYITCLKSSAALLILFMKKKDSFLHLCMNY